MFSGWLVAETPPPHCKELTTWLYVGRTPIVVAPAQVVERFVLLMHGDASPP